MKTMAEMINDVEDVLLDDWTTRKGRVVPDTAQIELGNDGVILDATVMYVDMVGSTKMVDNCKVKTAARFYKCFLPSVCHVIRNNDGTITSFDGDRVMAVFLGEDKEFRAFKTALNIRYCIFKINQSLKAFGWNYQIRYGCGIDSSKLFTVRSGIRGSNDLIWVGRAANYAAKLSAMRGARAAMLMTETTYNGLVGYIKQNPSRKCFYDKNDWYIAVPKIGGLWIFENDAMKSF